MKSGILLHSCIYNTDLVEYFNVIIFATKMKKKKIVFLRLISERLRLFQK